MFNIWENILCATGSSFCKILNISWVIKIHTEYGLFVYSLLLVSLCPYTAMGKSVFTVVIQVNNTINNNTRINYFAYVYMLSPTPVFFKPAAVHVHTCHFCVHIQCNSFKLTKEPYLERCGAWAWETRAMYSVCAACSLVAFVSWKVTEHFHFGVSPLGRKAFHDGLWSALLVRVIDIEWLNRRG